MEDFILNMWMVLESYFKSAKEIDDAYVRQIVDLYTSNYHLDDYISNSEKE